MTYVFTSYISLSLKAGCLSKSKCIDLRSIHDNLKFDFYTFFVYASINQMSKIKYFISIPVEFLNFSSLKYVSRNFR